MKPKKVCNNAASVDMTGLLEIIQQTTELYDSEGISYEYDIFCSANHFTVKFKIYG